MFAASARKYIESLITIQKHIRKQGYERDDQQTVNECRKEVKNLIETWKYSTDELMSGFWINHRSQIRYLVPTNTHKGFKCLLKRFEQLDQESQIIEFQNKITLKNQ